MLHLEQAVIVEGKYDKIKLNSIIDGVIITTNGFSVIKDKENIGDSYPHRFGHGRLPHKTIHQGSCGRR